jgi:hypothetical protein
LGFEDHIHIIGVGVHGRELHVGFLVGAELAGVPVDVVVAIVDRVELVGANAVAGFIPAPVAADVAADAPV